MRRMQIIHDVLWSLDFSRFPVWIRRRVMLAGAVVFVIMLLIALTTLVLWSQEITTGLIIPLLSMLLLGSAVLAASAVKIAIAMCTHEELLRREHYAMCGNCGYSLHQRHGYVKCPECGHQYDFDSVKLYWIRTSLATRDIHHSFGAIKALLLSSIFVIAMFVSGIVLYAHGMVELAMATPLILGCLFLLWLLWRILMKDAFKQGILRRRLLNVDYALCRHCHAELLKSDSDGLCAACGEYYNLHNVKTAWHDGCPPHWKEDVELSKRRTSPE